ncbi:MAG: DinB family protein [Anaerolineales bacterium]
MAERILGRLLEHNTWANLQIIQACSALTDAQLDAEPVSATKGSIRATLWHLMNAEQDYLSQLTGVEPRFHWEAPPAFAEMREAASIMGEGLTALARDESGGALQTQVHSKDGYTIDPWVLMLQIINHATEHREQVKSMLTALGVKPPRVDGWAFGRVSKALIPPST